jgi:ABC-2 type transport system permease protein
MVNAALPAPLPTSAQSRMFLSLRRRLFHNTVYVLIRRNRLRLLLVAVLTLTIWGGLYAMFQEGFGFLRSLEAQVPISLHIIKLLFGLFFLSLMGLMIFSTGLLLYGSMFRAPEATFLLSTPARTDQIFAYKFQEAMLFGGWSFLLLGTPLLLSYGIEMSAHWPYYLLFLPYLVGFLLLPGSIGALACLLIVHFLPRRRKQVLILLLGLAFFAFLIWAASAASGAGIDSVSEAWLRKFIKHMEPAQLPFLPSLWMTRGLIAGANGDFVDALFYLLLIWSNGLFFYLLSAWTAQRVYRSAYSRVTSSGGAKRKFGLHWTDRLAAGLLGWADSRTRLFVLKDFRTFRRDPVQWGQVLILAGILLLYFLNIPNLPHGHYELHQRTMIGLLNVSVIGLMLATYTSRFVFPMMSLEGRNFWILGLLPLERDRLLISKFAYAATFSVTISLALVILSELMLRLPWQVATIHMLAMLVLALGLSALSVGLGAYLVNLKETNPSKIATGFGGTINLLFSLAFAVLTVFVAGVPAIVYFADTLLRQQEAIVMDRGHWLWFGGCAGVVLLLGVLTIFVPLRMGMRAFRRMEF